MSVISHDRDRAPAAGGRRVYARAYVRACLSHKGGLRDFGRTARANESSRAFQILTRAAVDGARFNCMKIIGRVCEKRVTRRGYKFWLYFTLVSPDIKEDRGRLPRSVFGTKRRRHFNYKLQRAIYTCSERAFH